MSSVKLLRENLDNLIKSHDTLIKQNKFNEAFNVMKNVHIITEQLRHLGFSVIDEEDVSTDSEILDWHNVLKFFIENKIPQIIQLDCTDENAISKHRGTGKTTTILKLSSEHKIPVLYNNSEAGIREVKDMASLLNLKPIIIRSECEMNLKQYNNKIMLVDEHSCLDNINTDKYMVIGFTKNK